MGFKGHTPTNQLSNGRTATSTTNSRAKSKLSQSKTPSQTTAKKLKSSKGVPQSAPPLRLRSVTPKPALRHVTPPTTIKLGTFLIELPVPEPESDGEDELLLRGPSWADRSTGKKRRSSNRKNATSSRRKSLATNNVNTEVNNQKESRPSPRKIRKIVLDEDDVPEDTFAFTKQRRYPSLQIETPIEISEDDVEVNNDFEEDQSFHYPQMEMDAATGDYGDQLDFDYTGNEEAQTQHIPEMNQNLEEEEEQTESAPLPLTSDNLLLHSPVQSTSRQFSPNEALSSEPQLPHYISHDSSHNYKGPETLADPPKTHPFYDTRHNDQPSESEVPYWDTGPGPSDDLSSSEPDFDLQNRSLGEDYRDSFGQSVSVSGDEDEPRVKLAEVEEEIFVPTEGNESPASPIPDEQGQAEMLDNQGTENHTMENMLRAVSHPSYRFGKATDNACDRLKVYFKMIQKRRFTLKTPSSIPGRSSTPYLPQFHISILD